MLNKEQTGKRIKERRISLGMTQEQLAEKIGYHGKSTICHIEKGDSDMSQSKIAAIAKALDTTVDYILGFRDETILIETSRPADSAELLLKYFSAMSAENKSLLLKYAEFLANEKEAE